MVKPIVKDIVFLKQRSLPAGPADAPAGEDLLDTLKANRERCVGLAANMIGIRRRIIVVQTGLAPIVMFNPVITAHSPESYETEEGCLSLTGTRRTRRWEKVEVSYTDRSGKAHELTLSGFQAQIVQHEIDHCNGILI